MAKDPVCRMEVEPADAAATLAHQGKTYYFCSRHCVDSCRDDPDSYL